MRCLAKMDQARNGQAQELCLSCRRAWLRGKDALQEFMGHTAPIPDLGLGARCITQVLPLHRIEDQHFKLGIKVLRVIILELDGGLTAGFCQ